MNESDQPNNHAEPAGRMLISIREFSQIHQIFTSIVEKQIGGPVLSPERVQEKLEREDSSQEGRPISDPLPYWLVLLDMAVSPHSLRRHIQDQEVSEDAIRALIRFLVAKKSHTQADRDKVDWLITYLFRLREEKSKTPTGWPRAEVSEILEGMDFPFLSRYAEELLMEMAALIEEVGYLESFRQVTDSRIIERARDLKNQFGEEFFHPETLAAVVNYNLVFGKKFHALLRGILQEVSASATPGESGAIDPQELLGRNYRATASTFRQLSAMGEKKETEKGLRPAGGPPPPAREKRPVDLLTLGIDPARQGERLRNRIKEIAMRLKANPGLASIPCLLEPLLLSEWEAASLRAEFPESEKSFRVEYAHGVCKAIGILARIYDELAQYSETRGEEESRKRHGDALVYLLHEGRRHKEAMLRLSEVSLQRGLPEKSKQVDATSEKLEAGLLRLTSLFDAPLPDAPGR